MSDLIAIEARKQELEKTCLNGRIKRVEVHEEKLLRGINPGALQDSLANATFTQVMRKGKYLLLQTDRGQTLILSMNEDADLACMPYPATDHPADARVIVHFDDGHTLDIRVPSMNDLLYYFPTTDERVMEPLRGLGRDPWDMTFQQFHEALGTHLEPEVPIWSALLSQSRIAGLDPALADEICYQAKVRPDRKVKDLLKEEWRQLYDQMLAILQTLKDVNGDMAELDRRGFLMPRRGTDRGCPTGEGLSVIHFNGKPSYFCASCQINAPWEGKKADFW